jgi:hypothetical protein
LRCRTEILPPEELCPPGRINGTPRNNAVTVAALDYHDEIQILPAIYVDGRLMNMHAEHEAAALKLCCDLGSRRRCNSFLVQSSSAREVI